MRCACIDIGSNTTRLLLAEPEGSILREVRAERVFTRIGAACADNGRIPAAKIDEVAAVVAAQAAMALGSGANSLRAVATAAIRSAPNRDELLQAIRERCGVDVEVLDAHEEARLAFLGATGLCPGCAHETHDGARLVAVVDVGGGSTEIVVGTPAGGVTWDHSVALGSSVLAISRDGEDGPADARALAAAAERAATAFAGLDCPAVTRAVAVGGSATSLRLLAGTTLTREAIDRAVGILRTSGVAEVAGTYGLDPDRVRMLPAGLILLDAVARLLGDVPLETGRGGLREGVVLEQLLQGGWAPAE